MMNRHMIQEGKIVKRNCPNILLLALLILWAGAVGNSAAAQPLAEDEWTTQRFNIKWGLITKTEQLWDGHVELDQGEILDIAPFIRHEILYDSLMVSKNAWKSTTYTNAEGIYLTVHAPQEAKVSVFTKIHDFAFQVGDIPDEATQEELDGDISIMNVSSEVLFRIAGLEQDGYGKGTATIEPQTARANTPGTWTLTYTAPEGGLPVGGGVRVAWHFSRSWGEPQFSDPEGLNYVTVTTTGKSRLDYTSEHRGLLEYCFNRGRILIRIFDAPLRAGEQMIVTLGDTREGSPGLQAPWIANPQEIIRVEDCTEVPRGALPIYRRLERLPAVEVLPEEKPRRFFIVVPSLATAGRPFTAKLVAEDTYRNVVPDYQAELEVLIDGSPVRELLITKSDQGRLEIPGLVLNSPGAHWIAVREKNGDISGESNPVKASREPPPSQLVWGELHGHTENSDGYGTADDYLRLTRQRALLDFAAITDHDVELDAPDLDVSDMWNRVRDAARRHHDPPRFCTIPAYEWSPARVTRSTIAPFGDHNIFYTEDDMPLFMAEDPESNTLPKLYRKLEKLSREQVQVIPHVGGAISNWDYHHPGLEKICEIFSVHGSFEEFGLSALEKGYLLGFIGASDSHSGQVGGFTPGNVEGHFTHGGLAAVSVPALSRKNIFQAIDKRHVYATSGPRILIDFTINDEPMGSVIQTNRTPVLKAEVFGTAPLLTLEVIKNGRVMHSWTNNFRGEEQLTLLWSNPVKREELFDFDQTLWSSRLRFADWQGGIKAQSAVALENTCSFDYPKDAILEEGSNAILWKSQTRGDWDGVTLRLADPQAALQLRLGEHEKMIQVEDLKSGTNELTLEPSDRLLLVKGEPESRAARFEIKDHSILYKWNFYYLRVLQADGEMAWSSPIWISNELKPK